VELIQFVNPKERPPVSPFYDVDPNSPCPNLPIYSINLCARNTEEDLGFLVGVTRYPALKNLLAQPSYFNPSVSLYLISTDDFYMGIDSYTKHLVSFSPSPEQEKALHAFARNF